jgi:hypothetical protein
LELFAYVKDSQLGSRSPLPPEQKKSAMLTATKTNINVVYQIVSSILPPQGYATIAPFVNDVRACHFNVL